MSYFELRLIEEPMLEFYQGLSSNPRDITRLKPLSYALLLDEVQEIKIKLLVDNETRKLAKTLIHHLIHGYENTLQYPPFRTVFGLEVSFEEKDDITQVDLRNKDDFFTKLESSVDDIRDSGMRGIIIIASPFIPRDLFYEAKYRSMVNYSRSNIRLQFIKRKSIERCLQKGFEFLLLNLATAIYAKIGGIPWKLAHAIIPTGLILGISFIRERGSENSEEVIYYGAIEVLDKYGEHLITKMRMFSAPASKLKTEGLYVPYDRMYEILRDILKKNKVPLIILHKSSSFVENEELKALYDVIQEYKRDDFEIMYLAVHLKGMVLYRIFDTDVVDYSVSRGTLLIDKTSILRKRHWRGILFTTGRLPGRKRRGRLGTPRPLELDVVENESPLGLTDIASQVLALTKLDWNTTEPEIRKPITLKYSRKAARLACRNKILSMEIGDIRDLI